MSVAGTASSVTRKPLTRKFTTAGGSGPSSSVLGPDDRLGGARQVEDEGRSEPGDGAGRRRDCEHEIESPTGPMGRGAVGLRPAATRLGDGRTTRTTGAPSMLWTRLSEPLRRICTIVIGLSEMSPFASNRKLPSRPPVTRVRNSSSMTERRVPSEREIASRRTSAACAA